MKLFCSGTDLSDAVFTVIAALPKRKNISILEGIKLEAYGDELKITATDLELTIEKKIKANIKIEGEAVVAGKIFTDFIKKLSNEQVELDATATDRLKVKYGDSKCEFACLPKEEYPATRVVDNTLSFSLFQKDLKDLIVKTAFSVAQDDSRMILKGCLFELNDNALTVVALDGYRLAMSVKSLECNNIDNKKLIIPSRSLNEIKKILDEDNELVTVYIQNNFIMTEIKNTRITTQLIDGEYIAYKNIIPVSFLTEVIIGKEQFNECLERASVISRIGKNNLIKLDIKEKVLTVLSDSEEGNIDEKLPVKFTGQELQIAFNVKYLTDCMGAIEDEYIKLSFNNSKTPCVITPIENENYLYLILPVRVQG